MAPRGPDLQIYGRWNFGALAQFHVLDDRQYRDHQACPRENFGAGSNVVSAASCPELMDPRRTLLGARQEQWLADGLSATRARWNVIAQQTIMARVSRPLSGELSGEIGYWTDGWDGYPRARARLLEAVAGTRAANPLVIGGDVHTFAACDLKADFDNPNSRVMATEFVGSSITSQGISAKTIESWRDENPHIRYINSTRRGYVSMALSEKRCVARMRAVDEKNSASPVTTLAAWTVEDGRPGALRGG
jgi:alkaline phosphatase D